MATASLPAISDGPTEDEQMLMAEASTVSRQAELQTLRHDKREFIKVSQSTLLCSWRIEELVHIVQLGQLSCCRLIAGRWLRVLSSARLLDKYRAETFLLSSEPYWKIIG